jgi:hypothetical protein
VPGENSPLLPLHRDVRSLGCPFLSLCCVQGRHRGSHPAAGVRLWPPRYPVRPLLSSNRTFSLRRSRSFYGASLTVLCAKA